MGYFQDLGWFTSSNEKKRKSDIYKKMMYPFGQQQIDWEDKFLSETFNNYKKSRLVDLKYYLLVMKEKYLLDVSDFDEDKYEMICTSYNTNSSVIERLKIDQKDKDLLDKIAKIQVESKDLETLVQEIGKI